MSKRPLRLALGVPSMGTWYTDFATSLMHASLMFNNRLLPGYDAAHLRVISTKGSILSKSRWHILRDAIKDDNEYLMFVDSDHTFPSYAFLRLISHNVDIVGCNLVTKTIPALPTARSEPKEGGQEFGDLVYSDPDKHGLERVWRLGTGMMMIRLDAIRDLDHRGMFNTVWHESFGDYQGEDWSMCERFEAAGLKIHIDHDLSRECGHIGMFTYTHDLVGMVVREGENGEEK